MGQTNLATFRSRLQAALGDRDLQVGPLNSWINDGYLDMTGSHDFVELRVVQTVTLVGGNIGITLPDDLQWIRAVWNVEDKEQIPKISSEYLQAMEDKADDDLGAKFYSRDGNALYIQPPYVTDQVIGIHYNAEPAFMVKDGDKTILLTTYDRAIHMFSAAHALSDLGEEIRANEWMNKGIIYLRTRLDLEAKESTPGMHMGVIFPKTESDLRRLYGRPVE